MDSGSGCQPKRDGVSSTVVGQRAGKDWPPDWIVDEDPFLDDRYECRPFESTGKGSFSLKRYTFTKADRIRTSSEYRALSKKGKRQYSDCFIIISQKNQSSRSRLGITVSKKVGKAVTRNRIKRIIREFFRLNRSLLPGRLDINIIVRHSSGRIGAAAIRKQLDHCFKTVA